MKSKTLLLITMLTVLFSALASRAQKIHASIAGMSGGEITVNQLAKDSVLTLSDPHFDIISFRMSVWRKGRDPVEFNPSGNKLTSKMRKYIFSLHKGDKLFFDDIKAEWDTLIADPISFTIK